MNRTLLIEPREPLIFRDARPAGEGLSMRSVDWPLPSAVIGAIRSGLGKSTTFDPKTVSYLLQVEHVGPFLAEQTTGSGVWKLAFPAPADALLFGKDGGVEVVGLRPAPVANGAGTNLPAGLAPLGGARPQKPVPGPAFWTAENTLKWLSGAPPKVVRPAELGPTGLKRESRVHVKISADTGTADEGMLFTTEGLEFTMTGENQSDGTGRAAAIYSQVRSGVEWPGFDPVGPIGGEKRLAFWSDTQLALPKPPASLERVCRLRLQLVTPAAFDLGWKPGWLGEQNSGSPPGLPGLRLRLVGAAVPRPIFHSGWDLTRRAKDAQKATRLLAPAGSVYFFETDADFDVRNLWLRSICDGEQDRRDGFGIVLCGGWEWQ